MTSALGPARAGRCGRWRVPLGARERDLEVPVSYPYCRVSGTMESRLCTTCPILADMRPATRDFLFSAICGM